jgi:hypothetical protein
VNVSIAGPTREKVYLQSSFRFYYECSANRALQLHSSKQETTFFDRFLGTERMLVTFSGHHGACTNTKMSSKKRSNTSLPPILSNPVPTCHPSEFERRCALQRNTNTTRSTYQNGPQLLLMRKRAHCLSTNEPQPVAHKRTHGKAGLLQLHCSGPLGPFQACTNGCVQASKFCLQRRRRFRAADNDVRGQRAAIEVRVGFSIGTDACACTAQGAP